MLGLARGMDECVNVQIRNPYASLKSDWQIGIGEKALIAMRVARGWNLSRTMTQLSKAMVIGECGWSMQQRTK